MRLKTLAIVLALVTLAACATKQPAPYTPPTPTSTTVRVVAILSSTNLMSAQAAVSAHTLGKMSDANFAKATTYNAQVDTYCFTMGQVLRSTNTDAEKFAAATALTLALGTSSFTDPAISAQLAALAQSVLAVQQSIQQFNH